MCRKYARHIRRGEEEPAQKDLMGRKILTDMKIKKRR